MTRRWLGVGFVMVLAAFAFWQIRSTPVSTISIGSKSFTESAVLAAMLEQLCEDSGADAQVKAFAGSSLAFSALLAGEIDAYPEYTGTLKRELLLSLELTSDADLRQALAAQGITMSAPIGFNNTYAIGVTRTTADRLGLKRVSDLARHESLRLAFSTEFMNRGDGWPGLRDTYALHDNARGIEHSLAYAALASNTIDVTDLYSTDSQIAAMDLVVLEDDRSYFPRYDAVVLYRTDLVERQPKAVASMLRLIGLLDESTMREFNQRAEIGSNGEPRQPPAAVASQALSELLNITTFAQSATRVDRLVARTREHLLLVGLSMTVAILVAVPLGVLAARSRAVAGPVLAITGILQTIPALALLVLLIGPLGIGAPTAIVALILYSLLPIVRNTYSGLTSIPGDLLESADAIGLTSWARLRRVELPLALRTILAGIKTAAVINVGTATLGGFISAGGYGQPIFTGITQNNPELIFEGAIPAAVMAIAAQLLFDRLEQWAVPRGLRL